MSTYRLHYFPESGNSYKLALMLTLCGQTFEPVWTDFGGGVTRTPEWRRTVNADGRNPGAGGEWRASHPDRADPAQARRTIRPIWWRECRRAKFEVLRWLFWDNHKLTGYMATYRYHRTFTPSPDPHVLAYFRKTHRRLPWRYWSNICSTSAFAVGDRPTVADFSMIAYLSYPNDETGYDLAASHPAVDAWLRRVANLPGWRSPYDLLPGRRLTHYA